VKKFSFWYNPSLLPTLHESKQSPHHPTDTTSIRALWIVNTPKVNFVVVYSTQLGSSLNEQNHKCIYSSIAFFFLLLYESMHFSVVRTFLAMRFELIGVDCSGNPIWRAYGETNHRKMLSSTLVSHLRPLYSMPRIIFLWLFNSDGCQLGSRLFRVILNIILIFFLCPSKNDVAFKITMWSKFNFDQSQAQWWF
jgi:hypothetical protein